MRIAVWNIRPCSLLFGSADPDSIEILYRDPAECKSLLNAGEVDAALVPINDVLRDVEDYVVLSNAVLASATTFPYATLRLNGPIDEIHSVGLLSGNKQAGEITEIVLREEYGVNPDMRLETTIPVNGATPDAWLSLEDPGSAAAATDGRWLDIGQEWFELTALPLIWGVFAVRAGRPTAQVAARLESLVSEALSEEGLESWLAENPQLSGDEQTALESVRFRYDAEVIAGLDELAHYLFYFGKVDDIPAPRFSKPPEATPNAGPSD